MTKAISYQRSAIVNRPANEVWAYVADYTIDLQWRHGLIEMTPFPAGPPQTGTTVHEEVRSMGTTVVNDTTVTITGNTPTDSSAADPSERWRAAVRSLHSIAAGASSVTTSTELSTGRSDFFGFILRPILSRKLQSDLERFRALAETDTEVVEPEEVRDS